MMFWKKAKQQPELQNPKISFEVWPNGNVTTVCDWPQSSSTEEQMAVATRFGSAIFFLNDGQLLSLMQQAVAVAGHLKGQEKLAEHVLGVVNYMLRQKTEQVSECSDQDAPLIPADMVFRPE